MRARIIVLTAGLLSGCGACGPVERELAAPAAVPFGPAPRHRPGSLSPAVRSAEPVGRLRCSRPAARAGRAVAHLELFADGRGMVVPAGIGVAPPRRRSGAYVRGGRCAYPVRSWEPTGVLEVDPSARPTLGDVFALLGEPLSRRRLASFRRPVRVWLDGREWRGDPRAVPLRHHAQVVVAAGAGPIPVHASYTFAP